MPAYGSGMAGRIMQELRIVAGPVPVDRELFLNLLITAERVSRVEAGVLKEAGFQRSQYNVLRILRGAGAEGLACSAIAERMIAALPDMTRLIDRLEQQGLVRRGRSAADRRVVRVTISAEGLRRIAPLDALLDACHAGLFASLDATQKSTLIDLLEQVRAGLHESAADQA